MWVKLNYILGRHDSHKTSLLQRVRNPLFSAFLIARNSRPEMHLYPVISPLSCLIPTSGSAKMMLLPCNPVSALLPVSGSPLWPYSGDLAAEFTSLIDQLWNIQWIFRSMILSCKCRKHWLKTAFKLFKRIWNSSYLRLKIFRVTRHKW